MAEFLTTYGVSHEIEQIITNARSKLFILSPYLQLSNTFFDRLKDADRRGIAITIIYGKDEDIYDQREWLSQLNHLALHYFQKLHAKCYFNEDCMVITSMNMYQYSQQNNREMGVLISRSQDEKLFNAAEKEALSILDASTKVPLEKQGTSYKVLQKAKTRYTEAYTKRKEGVCIRCSRNVNYNTEAPYCKECFYKWADFQNPFYVERYCHKCGRLADTSMDKPLCYPCFSRS